MDRQQTKRTPWNIFRCGSVDNLIDQFPKPSKDNEKQRKQVRFNDRVSLSSQKESKNGDNYNDQKIYADMSWMSGND